MSTDEPTVIRSSSLTSYPGCERRGAAGLIPLEILSAGYELQESKGASIAAVVGNSVHAAAKVVLEEKAASGELPPVSISNDAAIQWLRDSIREGVTYDPMSSSKNTAEIQVRRMSTVYHYAVAAKIKPLQVETRLEAEIPSTRQRLVISGQSDSVAVEARDETFAKKIRDLKTGAAKLGSHAPQIGSYSMLGRSHGLDITGAAVDWVQRVSVKKPQPAPAVQEYETGQAESAAMEVIDQIDRGLTSFREGDDRRKLLPGDARSFPANPSSMLCSQKYCRCYGVNSKNAFCHDWRPKESISRDSQL